MVVGVVEGVIGKVEVVLRRGGGGGKSEVMNKRVHRR